MRPISNIKTRLRHPEHYLNTIASTKSIGKEEHNILFWIHSRIPVYPRSIPNVLFSKGNEYLSETKHTVTATDIQNTHTDISPKF